MESIRLNLHYLHYMLCVIMSLHLVVGICSVRVSRPVVLVLIDFVMMIHIYSFLLPLCYFVYKNNESMVYNQSLFEYVLIISSTIIYLVI